MDIFYCDLHVKNQKILPLQWREMSKKTLFRAHFGQKQAKKLTKIIIKNMSTVVLSPEVKKMNIGILCSYLLNFDCK